MRVLRLRGRTYLRISQQIRNQVHEFQKSEIMNQVRLCWEPADSCYCQDFRIALARHPEVAEQLIDEGGLWKSKDTFDFTDYRLSDEALRLRTAVFESAKGVSEYMMFVIEDVAHQADGGEADGINNA